MICRHDDIAFEFFGELVEEQIATIRISTPAGIILAMASVSEEAGGRRLVLSGLHMQMQDGRANVIGSARLRRLAEILMEQLDYDELVIEGAVRTSGANPGHRPRIRRFTRGRRPASGA